MAEKKRFTSRLAVYLVLIHDGKILLSLRQNTGFADGLYSLISGHVDEGETIRHAMVREAQEEVAIKLEPQNLKLVHVMQRQGMYHYIEFYFMCTTFAGNPLNCEPEKCGDVRFFQVNHLPENIADNVRKALKEISLNNNYSEYGNFNNNP
jgi:ADP-ribose pyrophosphatase YjhB (NUDIX family)